MAVELKVSPEVLRQTAEELEKEISRISREFDLIESDISLTRIWWEGEASEAHIAQYEGMREEIRETLARLQSSPVTLLQMAGLYSQTDSELEDLSGQMLSADVIM